MILLLRGWAAGRGQCRRGVPDRSALPLPGATPAQSQELIVCTDPSGAGQPSRACSQSSCTWWLKTTSNTLYGARHSRALPFYQARRSCPTACIVPGSLAATAQSSAGRYPTDTFRPCCTSGGTGPCWRGTTVARVIRQWGCQMPGWGCAARCARARRPGRLRPGRPGGGRSGTPSRVHVLAWPSWTSSSRRARVLAGLPGQRAPAA